MKNVWKSLIFTLVLVTAFGMLSSISLAANPIKVQIDGKELKMEVPPKEINNRVMVPLRSIFEALGMEVNYNKGTITAIKGYFEIKLHVGKKEIDCNQILEGTITSDVAPKQINGYVYVPLRSIADTFGCLVDWDANEKTVKINNGILVKPYLPNYVSHKTIDLTGVPYYSDYPAYQVPDFGKAINYDASVDGFYHYYDGAKVQEADFVGYVEALKKQGYEFVNLYIEQGNYEVLSVGKGDVYVNLVVYDSLPIEYRYVIVIVNEEDLKP